MPVATDLLTIGEVSARSGVAASALRYYESLGLISSVRSGGGQRRYPRAVLRRIAFVRVAQQVGLSLEEIADALATLPESRPPTVEDWQRISGPWEARIDARIRELQVLRSQLTSCIGCGCLSLGACALYNRGDVASTRGTGPRRLREAVEAVKTVNAAAGPATPKPRRRTP